MTIIDILLVVIFIFELLLGVFVLANNPKRIVNKALAFFSFAVVGWGSSVLVVKYTESILAARFAFAFGTLLILAYVFFAAVFPDRKSLKPRFYLAALPALFFLIFSFFGDLLFTDFVVEGGAIVAERGVLYPLFVIFAIVYIVLSAFFLVNKYRTSLGKTRLQMNYFLAGLFAFMVGGAFSNVVFPAFGLNDFNTIGPAFSIFFVIATTYSVVRFRLMDIRFVFRRSFVYVSALFSLLLLVLVGSEVKDAFVFITIPEWIRTLLIVVFSILAFEPLHTFYSNIANKYFFTGLYNYQRATEDFIKRLTTLIEIEQIVDLAKEVAMRHMKIDDFAFVLLDPSKRGTKYVVSSIEGFDMRNIKDLIRDKKYIKHVSDLSSVYSLDFAESAINKKKRHVLPKRTSSAFKKQGVRLIVPFYRKEKLNGFMLLGAKATKDAFTSLDYDFLTTMSLQAAIAIENAMLYQEVQDYSENLEEKVEEQTREIKELYEMKSNFLTVASHQLRTPTSIIRGMLSMLVEEDIPADKKDEMVEAAFKSSSGLERVIDDILTAAEIDSSRFDFDPEPVDIFPLAERIVEDLQLKAEKKNVKLKLIKPRFKTALALTNRPKIEQAFVNLVDNALNYTSEGSVTVRITKEKVGKQEMIAFACTDTGVGMTKSDIRRIGEKFYRSKNVFSVHPNGTGLGIFIVKQVVKASKGKLVLESEGLGKGSTFKILLKRPKK